MDTEIIYLGHDNEIDLVLLENGAPVALDAVTRVVCDLGATSLDSDSLGFGAGQPFDPTVTGIYGGQSVDLLRLLLGGQSIPEGLYRGRLVLYDPSHPGGVVWTESLRVRVTT